jgi:hypothetical protein
MQKYSDKSDTASTEGCEKNYWDAMQCTLVDKYGRFGGICSLYFIH